MQGVGKPLAPDELEWLDAYEEAHPVKKNESFGASRSRKLTHIEEEAEAMGTGDAAAAAAAASREEGRRIDYLASIGTDALVRACKLHEQMAAALLQRSIADGETIRQLTDSVRGHALTSAQLEADKLIADAEREAEAAGENGAMEKMVAEMLPHIMKQLNGVKK
jgi:hypothetical protein